MRTPIVILLLAGLAGCVGRPFPPPAPVTFHPKSDPRAGSAIVFVDGERVPMHSRSAGVAQSLQFRSLSSNMHVRGKGDMPFWFETGTGPAFRLVPPGRYILAVARDNDGSGQEAYSFGPRTTPVSFTVRAGDAVDIGHVVLRNEALSACSDACAAVLTARVERHGAEERETALAQLADALADPPQNLATRPASIAHRRVAFAAAGGTGSFYASQKLLPNGLATGLAAKHPDDVSNDDKCLLEQVSRLQHQAQTSDTNTAAPDLSVPDPCE